MRVVLVTAVLLLAGGLAACGAESRASAPAATPTPAATPRARHSALRARPPLRVSGLARAMAIARRTYRLEAHGPAAPASVRRISRDPVLLAALRAHDLRALRAAALHQLFLPHYHVVRLRVLRAGRSLVDVGGRFVSAGAHRELRTASGRPLGRLEASIQDIIGFVKLIHRRSGAQAVVRGLHGHVATLLPAAAKVRLPSAGVVMIGGRADSVGMLRETGFGGEPLRVWILVAR